MSDMPNDLKQKALAEFTDYFVRSYPGPNTVIYDQKWHAPRIFRAAVRAMTTAVTAEDYGHALASEINALPDHLRRYIADLEQRADPAGDVRRAHVAEETAATLAKRVEEFEQPRPAVGVDEQLIDRLEMACIAACSCLTKTPDWQHHETNCRYRLFQESIAALDRSAQECEHLKCSITDLNDRLEESHQEYAGLSEQVTKLENICADSRTQLGQRDQAIANLLSRLASLDACLREVREEMPEVEEIRKVHAAANPQQREHGWQFAYDSIDRLLSAIEKLQSKEGANRNAIKMHLETIAADRKRIEFYRHLLDTCEKHLGIPEDSQDTTIIAEIVKLQECYEFMKGQDEHWRRSYKREAHLAHEATKRADAAEARERGLRDALQKVKDRIEKDCTVMGIEPHSWHRICLHYSEVVRIYELLAAQPAAVELDADDKAALKLCSDCPPAGYPTDETRCRTCPLRAQPAAAGREE
jgi:hypothetical protein